MKMDNPATITVLGSIVAVLVAAVFGIYAGNVQKRQSDADKAELLNANRVLSDSVNQKNEELIRMSNDHKLNLEEYTKKLEHYAAEQKAKDKEVIKRTTELKEEAISQKQQTQEVLKSSLELIEAQKQTINFTSESLKYLTGGDSYCFVSMLGFTEGKDELRVKLFHYGKYPLSALRVTITRTSAIIRQAEKTGSHPRILSGVHQVTFPVGPLPSSPEPYELGTVSFTPKILETYYVQFFAQNGTWTQKYGITYGQDGNPIIESKISINGKEIDMGFNSPKYKP